MSETATSALSFEINDTAKQNVFFTALGRLTDAKTFFQTHKKEIKSAVSQLESIEKLLKVAMEACQSEFERLMSMCGKSFAVQNGKYSVS